MRIPTNCIIPFTIACTLLSGCSQSTTHGTIQGTVTLDGEKMKEGVVRFVPVDGSSQTASASIVAGEFSAKVPVGTMRVECSAAKIIGQQKMYGTADSPKVDIVDELLPARYNVRSELTIDVRPGKQPHAIELFSQ